MAAAVCLLRRNESLSELSNICSLIKRKQEQNIASLTIGFPYLSNLLVHVTDIVSSPHIDEGTFVTYLTCVRHCHLLSVRLWVFLLQGRRPLCCISSLRPHGFSPAPASHTLKGAGRMYISWRGLNRVPAASGRRRIHHPEGQVDSR